MLLVFKNSRVEYKKLLKPFDYKYLPRSNVKESEVFNLIKEFSNSSLYYKSINSINIDQSSFNIEFLDKNILTRAEEFLEKIKNSIEELESFSLSNIHDEDNIGKIQKLNMKIFEYSNQYYELLPRERFKNRVNCLFAFSIL